MTDATTTDAGGTGTGTGGGTAPEGATTAPSGRWRSVVAAICFVLAALLTLPAAVAHWGQRTITDTERYIETVGPLVSQEEVQQVLGDKITSIINEQLDIQGLADEAFGPLLEQAPRLELLIPPLEGAIESFIDGQVRAFLASDLFRDLWIEVNTRAQQTLIRLLEGNEDPGAIQLEGDDVVLDISTLVEAVKQRLVDRGLTIVQNIPIPETDAQIVLLRAPQLAQARTIYAFANPVATWAIFVIVALFALAFLLSRRRPRMTVWIGAAAVVNAVVLGVAITVGEQLFVNTLLGTPFGPASRVFYATLLTYLVNGWHTILIIGIVLILAGWFAGRNQTGTQVRGWVSGGLERAGSRFPAGPVSDAGRFVEGAAFWVRGIIIAIALVLVLWVWNFNVTSVLWTTAITALVLAALQVLIGAAHPADTEAPAEPEAVPV